ncbi:MAG: hypothetical protein DHS20C15_12190 [Planctomycetota bacterium]|nr:MAG: hypothetical protein DHS20C15_12190 [Planctomycetota bacterium]
MKLTLLLAWRNLAGQPWRTLASVLGIALGIATVVAVLVVDHNTLLSHEARRAPENPEADLLIQPDLRLAENYDALLRDLAGEDLLLDVAALATGRFAVSKGRASADTEIMALDAAMRSAHAGYELHEGVDIDFELGGPQMLVTAGLAQRLDLAVGDSVNVQARSRRRGPVTTCIDGVMSAQQSGKPSARGGNARAGSGRDAPSAAPVVTEFRVVGILAPTRLGFHKARALVSIDAGRALLGNAFTPRFWADFDTARTDYPSLSRRLSDRYVLSTPKRALAGLAPEEQAFRSGVRMCGFLALLLGLYIIFNTMSMSLVERVRSLGLLRSLGLTNGRLFVVFLVEGLMLSLAGAVSALLLAKLLVDTLVSLKITTLGFGRPLEIREIPWTGVISVMSVGVVFCLLGVLYPFLRASRLSVIEALRRGVIELSRDPFSGLRRSVLIGLLAAVPVAWSLGTPSEAFLPESLYHALLKSFGLVAVAMSVLLLAPGLLAWLARAALGLLPGPGATLARQSLAAARHRLFGTVSGLMLVFTAIFVIVSVLESLKNETREFGARALGDRVYIKITPEGAKQLDVLRAAAPEFAELSALNAEVSSSFVVRGLDSSMLARGPLSGDAELREAFTRDRTILLSTRCADDLDVLPGDNVRLATRSARGIEDYRVLAITDAYGFAPDDRVFGVISSNNLRNDWCVDSAGLGDHFVTWAPGLSDRRLGQLREVAHEALGAENVLELRTGEQITAHYVTDLDRDFAIFYAILLLTVLLAAVGILNAMVIAVLERRREIGLLRAVGLTAGQLGSMLLAEALVVGVLGGLFGLALGIPLASVCVSALTDVSNLELSYGVSGAAVSAVLGGSVLVSLLAVAVPVLRAQRLRVSNVLRYE